MSLSASSTPVAPGERWSVGFSIWTWIFHETAADIVAIRAMEGQTLEGAYRIDAIAYAKDHDRVSVNVTVLKYGYQSRLIATLKDALEQAGNVNLYTDWIKNISTGEVKKQVTSVTLVDALTEKTGETVVAVGEAVGEAAKRTSDLFGFKYIGLVLVGVGLIALVVLLKK